MVLLIPAAAGLAATRTGEPATALAFTAPDGTVVTLKIQDTTTRGLCRDLTIGTTELADDTCDEPVLAAADALDPVTVRTAGLTVISGTVRDATRRVDVSLSNGTVRKLKTVAAQGYTGRYRGKLRFWGVAVQGDEEIGSITLRNADGTATAATDVDRAALPLAGARVKLDAIEDFDRKPNALYALAPKVLVNGDRSPTRRRAALCVATKHELGYLTDKECALKRARLQITYARGCKDPHITLYGVGPASIRSATGIYAGSRRPIKVYRVPPSVGRPGVVLFANEDGEARIRRVQVFNRAGQKIGTATLRQTECKPSDLSVGGGVSRVR